MRATTKRGRGCAIVLRGLTIVLLVSVGAVDSASARTPKRVCRQCRTQCQEGLTACIAADTRLATCPAKRQQACLKRAKRSCKRNLKTCCVRYCQDTGLVQCCGSATSAVPPSRGGPPITPTTMPGGQGSTTTTLPPGTTACAVDDDCPTCQCCNAGRCGGVSGSGVGNCCNLPGGPVGHLNGVCGPKTPEPCPAETKCVSGTQQGEIRYHCGSCAGSNNIVEVVTMNGAIPPISQPSNACTRR